MVSDTKFQYTARLRFIFALVIGLFTAVLAGVSAAQAERIGANSGLPLPRYVSLKAHEVNFRRGPGWEYGVLWILRRRHLPVKVIGEYDIWRRIELHTQERGWVHSALLSARRFATPLEPGAVLFKAPSETASRLAEIAPAAPMRLKRCQDDWCEVDVAGAKSLRSSTLTGWALRRDLWGVGGDQRFD